MTRGRDFNDEFDDEEGAPAGAPGASFWRKESRLLLKVLAPLVLAAVIKGAQNSGDQLEDVAGVAIDFGMVNEAARKWAQEYSYDLVRGITSTTRDYLRGAVSKWTEEGRNLPDLIDELAGSGIFDERRAALIATTEATRAFAEGNQISWRESGVVQGKRWMTAQDELVCPICGGLDGEEVGLDETFDADGEDVDGPPAHPNCILPGTMIDLLGRPAAAMKSRYVGRCVEIRTGGGRRLTVTENHPILTARGWVPAQFIRKSDHVCVTPNGQRITSAIDPNNNNGPAAIEQIFDSLLMSSSMAPVCVPVAPEYLHGDGRSVDGNVEIVWADGFLSVDRQVKPSESIGQLLLNGDAANFRFLNGSGAFDFLVEGSNPPARRIMRGLRHPLSFARGSALPSRAHGVGYGARLDAGGEQSLANRAAINSVFSGETLLGFPGDIARDHRVNIGEGVASTSSGSGVLSANRNARALKMPIDRFALDTDLASKFLGRFASEVAWDDVVEIDFFEYAGHVYDLHVEPYHVYSGNSIIVSNCRCYIQPVVIRD